MGQPKERSAKKNVFGEKYDEITSFDGTIQGGSDKSGIFFFLLSNDTAQLKIIRFG